MIRLLPNKRASKLNTTLKTTVARREESYTARPEVNDGSLVHGDRRRSRRRRRTAITDGPFTESKELLGGWAWGC